MSIFYSIVVEETSSTMDLAKEIIKEKPNTEAIGAVFAKVQSTGRGRAGSSWTQGDFWPLTLIIPSKICQIPPEWLSTITGVAIYDAFQEVAPQKLYLKWPNDVLEANFKKICGILCESSSTNNRIEYFFVGIGINLFQHPGLENTSALFSGSEQLDAELRKEKRRIFWAALQLNIQQYFTTGRTREELKFITMQRSLPLNTILSVNKGTLRGAFLGIDENAALLLEGHPEPIFSGDVAL